MLSHKAATRHDIQRHAVHTEASQKSRQTVTASICRPDADLEQTTVSLIIKATHKKTLLIDLLFLKPAHALGERRHNEPCQQVAPLLYYFTFTHEVNLLYL